MNYRKELKKAAKAVLKKHYWLFVLLCLLAFVSAGGSMSSYTNSGNGQNIENAVSGNSVTQNAKIQEQFQKVLGSIAAGGSEEGEKVADENIKETVKESKEHKGAVLGRSRGVFSMMLNRITSGAFIVSLTVGISSIVGSDSAALVILIVGGLLLLTAVWVFFTNLFTVITSRMFLESRCYEKVHIQRALFLFKARKWTKAAWTMLVLYVYQLLWSLTLVGGVIKHYSYFLVPYIVAENPDLKANEAITLSRRMMKGHKWECFLLEISFFGWYLLGGLTFGLVDFLYTRPYMAASFSEYYVRLREMGKADGIENIEALNDRYLYEKASEEVLSGAYADVLLESEKPVTGLCGLTGIPKFLADVFGITLWNNKKERQFEEDQARMLRIANDKSAPEGLIYPARLSAVPEREKRQWLNGMNYLRCYSVWSLLLMFFIMSFGGWLWEVSLHLISDGVFVNRGVLHGPWLPIYGTGSVMILVLLYSFRKKPALEFLATVVVCGLVEYFTAYYLEMTHDGMKWWDYSGYFLNLHGRICAEGLLVFGVGGMVIVYILAPVLDNLIRRLPFKAVVAAGLILLGVFCADQAYSHKYPNQGEGITNYTAFAETVQYPVL